MKKYIAEQKKQITTLETEFLEIKRTSLQDQINRESI